MKLNQTLGFGIESKVTEKAGFLVNGTILRELYRWILSTLMSDMILRGNEHFDT